MRIGIFGRGRLGSALAEAADEAGDVALVWHLGREVSPDAAAGEVDVALEVSAAEAVPSRITWAREAGVPLVVGTTGWTVPEDLAIRQQPHPALLLAPNFSLTLALMARFARILGAYTDLGPDRDPWIFEQHHHAKADAPSGTARMLAQAVLAGTVRKTDWTSGSPTRGQLPIASLRAGAEPGRHTVGYDSPLETFEITHRARSRRLFAEGGLDLARWVQGRRGLLTLDDIARHRLTPLFQQVIP